MSSEKILQKISEKDLRENLTEEQLNYVDPEENATEYTKDESEKILFPQQLLSKKLNSKKSQNFLEKYRNSLLANLSEKKEELIDSGDYYEEKED